MGQGTMAPTAPTEVADVWPNSRRARRSAALLDRPSEGFANAGLGSARPDFGSGPSLSRCGLSIGATGVRDLLDWCVLARALLS